jgi:hypothetical protein
MLSPLIERSQRTGAHPRDCDPRKNERGVTIALVALSIVGIISMAALSIDIGTLYQSKAEAQRAADAAALTAARVISLSGVTGDPLNSSNSWGPTCGGGGSAATLAATAIAQAQQNFVGGIPVPTVAVNYGPAAAANADCSALATPGSAFAVNPTVTVTVTSGTLPIFFAKVFSLFPGVNYSNTKVSATAAAEVFNPSGSSALATGLVSVQPRCVKPWIVPNFDPGSPAGCTFPGCNHLVDPTTGSIVNPGIEVSNAPPGTIGETFSLIADCASNQGLSCNGGPPYNPQPVANYNPLVPPQPNLQYLPGLVSYSIAAPAASRCATGSGSNSPYYQQAIAGCDQTTVYQCGVQYSAAPTPNEVDLSENPSYSTGDTATATQCLIGEGSEQADGPPIANGQDSLATTSIPYQITAGSANPQNVSGLISSSNSIVSLPIYDATTPLVVSGTTAPITIVGFLQVFINYVDTNGNVNVTVLNVAGCGNQAQANGVTPVVTGTSPVPVRLITPP